MIRAVVFFLLLAAPTPRSQVDWRVEAHTDVMTELVRATASGAPWMRCASGVAQHRQKVVKLRLLDQPEAVDGGLVCPMGSFGIMRSKPEGRCEWTDEDLRSFASASTAAVYIMYCDPDTVRLLVREPCVDKLPPAGRSAYRRGVAGLDHERGGTWSR